jgi:hypothetical protein
VPDPAQAVSYPEATMLRRLAIPALALVAGLLLISCSGGADDAVPESR